MDQAAMDEPGGHLDPLDVGPRNSRTVSRHAFLLRHPQMASGHLATLTGRPRRIVVAWRG